MKKTSVENEMQRLLKEEYGQVVADEKVSKTASKKEDKVNKFAKVVSELVACAEQLDDIGHPLADEVDATLEAISKELSGE